MNNYDAAKILGVSGTINPETTKKAYRTACAKFHPDRNLGGLEMMKLVNAAYEVLKQFDGDLNHKAESYGDDLMAVINSLSDLPAVTLEICGAWLWIHGNTKPHKEALKSLKCRWSPNKKLWYFRPEDYKSRSRGKSSATMEEIREAYGSKSVKNGYQKLHVVA